LQIAIRTLFCVRQFLKEREMFRLKKEQLQQEERKRKEQEERKRKEQEEKAKLAATSTNTGTNIANTTTTATTNRLNPSTKFGANRFNRFARRSIKGVKPLLDEEETETTPLTRTRSNSDSSIRVDTQKQRQRQQDLDGSKPNRPPVPNKNLPPVPTQLQQQLLPPAPTSVVPLSNASTSAGYFKPKAKQISDYQITNTLLRNSSSPITESPTSVSTPNSATVTRQNTVLIINNGGNQQQQQQSNSTQSNAMLQFLKMTSLKEPLSKRDEVIRELYVTEVTYAESLKLAVKVSRNRCGLFDHLIFSVIFLPSHCSSFWCLLTLL
jgi:hypothetical protein